MAVSNNLNDFTQVPLYVHRVIRIFFLIGGFFLELSEHPCGNIVAWGSIPT